MSQLYVDNIRNRTGGPIGIPTGAVVTGVLTATTGNITGNMTVGGVLTYEDVTNIDSVGLITARSGIEFGASGVGGTITATGQAEFVGVSTFSSDVSIADKISHIGDSNTAIRFPAADTFTVETNSSERLRVASTGSIGINTDTPQSIVHIHQSKVDNAPARTAALYLENNANCEIQMVGNASNDCQLRFGTGGNNFKGAFEYQLDNDALLAYTSGSERMRIDSSGNIFTGGADSTSGIETGTQAGKVFKTGHTASSGATSTSQSFHFSFANPNGFVGSISTNGSNTSFNTSSDHRLKENVIDLDGAIDRVKQLAPKRFNFITDADTTVDGFLAHEAQDVVPEAVTGTHNEIDDDGNPVIQSIDHSKLVPLLTGALQEAIAKIESLEKRIKSLES